MRWSIEWGAAGQLAQQGVSGNSLKVGDHVIVTGSPGRNADDHRLRMRSIERPPSTTGANDGLRMAMINNETFDVSNYSVSAARSGAFDSRPSLNRRRRGPLSPYSGRRRWRSRWRRWPAVREAVPPLRQPGKHPLRST